jgi:hypothetical protein
VIETVIVIAIVTVETRTRIKTVIATVIVQKTAKKIVIVVGIMTETRIVTKIETARNTQSEMIHQLKITIGIVENADPRNVNGPTRDEGETRINAVSPRAAVESRSDILSVGRETVRGIHLNLYIGISGSIVHPETKVLTPQKILKKCRSSTT